MPGLSLTVVCSEKTAAAPGGSTEGRSSTSFLQSVLLAMCIAVGRSGWDVVGTDEG